MRTCKEGCKLTMGWNLNVYAHGAGSSEGKCVTHALTFF